MGFDRTKGAIAIFASFVGERYICDAIYGFAMRYALRGVKDGGGYHIECLSCRHISKIAKQFISSQHS